jgi:hypothetical protein
LRSLLRGGEGAQINHTRSAPLLEAANHLAPERAMRWELPRHHLLLWWEEPCGQRTLAAVM